MTAEPGRGAGLPLWGQVWGSEASLGSSVYVRNEAIAHSPAVLFPGRAVLPPALAHVSGIPVHQQDDEVDHVVPRQEVLEACPGERERRRSAHLARTAATSLCAEHELTAGQRPGQSHEEVSQVVRMANHTPPARHQQALPRGCRDALQICSTNAQRHG